MKLSPKDYIGISFWLISIAMFSKFLLFKKKSLVAIVSFFEKLINLFSCIGMDLKKTGCFKEIFIDCSKSPFNPGVEKKVYTKTKIKKTKEEMKNFLFFFFSSLNNLT